MLGKPHIMQTDAVPEVSIWCLVCVCVCMCVCPKNRTPNLTPMQIAHTDVFTYAEIPTTIAITIVDQDASNINMS